MKCFLWSKSFGISFVICNFNWKNYTADIDIDIKGNIYISNKDKHTVCIKMNRCLTDGVLLFWYTKSNDMFSMIKKLFNLKLIFFLSKSIERFQFAALSVAYIVSDMAWNNQRRGINWFSVLS